MISRNYIKNAISTLLFFCLLFAGCGDNLVQKRQEIFDKYNKIVEEQFLKKCQDAQVNTLPPNIFTCSELQNNNTYSYEILNNFFVINIAREQLLLDVYNQHMPVAGYIKNPAFVLDDFLSLFRETYFLPDTYMVRELQDMQIGITRKPYLYEYFLNSPDKEIDNELLKIGEDFKNETKELNNLDIAREFVEQNAILKTEYEISHHIGNDLNNLEKLKIFMNEKVAPETKEQLNKIAALNVDEITRKYEEEDFKKRYNDSAGLMYLSDETNDSDIDYSNIKLLEEHKNYIFLNRGIHQYTNCDDNADCDKTIKLDDGTTLISYGKRKHYILVQGKTKDGYESGTWDLLKYEDTRFVKEINKTVAFFTIIPDRAVLDYSEFIHVPNHIT